MIVSININDSKFNLAIWRQMTKNDIDYVYQIAAECHPDLPEARNVLAEKQQLAPQYCWILELRHEIKPGRDTKYKENLIAGYLLAHPWLHKAIPKLDSHLHSIPEQSDVLYVHDLALSHAARGHSLANLAIDQLTKRAKENGFKALSLTSVHNTTAFWQKQGFMPLPVDSDKGLKESLASYEKDASFMLKKL